MLVHLTVLTFKTLHGWQQKIKLPSQSEKEIAVAQKTFRSKTECVALLPLLFSCCFPLVLEYLEEGLMVMADSSLWELLFLCE